MPGVRSALALLLILVVGVAAACGGDGDGEAARTVVATTAQIGALTREVAEGQDIDVVVLIKPGVDAHDYDPTAEDIKAIGRAALVFKNGIGLDDFVDDAIESAGGDARLVTVTAAITPREGEDGSPDPHVWHDPILAKVMVDAIAEALAEADPPAAEAYRANARAYGQRLDEVDAEIRALIDAVPVENRKMVTNHDAFGYFIDRYGLEFVGAVIPSTDSSAEPSAQDIADLIDAIEREGVKAIFAESSIDPRIARQIAEDTGVTIVDDLYGDSLGDDGSGAETVDGMLLANARKIAEALR